MAEGVVLKQEGVGLGGVTAFKPVFLRKDLPFPIWRSLICSLSGADPTTNSRGGPGLARHNPTAPSLAHL